MRITSSWLYAAVLVTAVLFSLIGVGRAAWIPLKAELAQWLIERSWQASAGGSEPRPPWPWADTRPVAILGVPDHDLRLFVLEGNSGRNLAFGPVLLDGVSLRGDVVISGHRDTHFRFLRALRAGDRLELADARGSRWYRVAEMEVVDSRRADIVIDVHADRLSLVTCFPFDAPTAGGPLRYVVTAYPAPAPPTARSN